MSMCHASHFPCFNYHENNNQQLPHVMEQIAAIKLYHIPKALLRGVDVFMLDLDVGFLNSPIPIINAFYETPDIDIIVQVIYTLLYSLFTYSSIAFAGGLFVHYESDKSGLENVVYRAVT